MAAIENEIPLAFPSQRHIRLEADLGIRHFSFLLGDQPRSLLE